MNKNLLSFLVFSLVSLSLVPSSVFADGLPKPSVQVLLKALQDSNAEVRLSAAQALGQFEEPLAVKALESALIASAEAAEQDALVKAIVLNKDSGTSKRLNDAFNNPQFNWGKGAKAHAVQAIARIGGKKSIKWLTDVVGGEFDADIRAAAARELGAIGAPPKKEKKD